MQVRRTPWCRSDLGTAPLAASSGQVVRHRLSRAGDRKLNHALYMMAMVQVRCPSAGQAYYQRKRCSTMRQPAVGETSWAKDELPAAGMAALREAVLDYYADSFRFPVAQPSGWMPRCRGGACNAGSSAGTASPPTSFLRSPLCSMFRR
jgi:hypothetical protein